MPLTRPDAGASKGGGGGWPVLLTRRRDEGAAQAPEAVSGGDGGGTQENGDCEDGKGKVEKLVAWWWEGKRCYFVFTNIYIQALQHILPETTWFSSHNF